MDSDSLKPAQAGAIAEDARERKLRHCSLSTLFSTTEPKTQKTKGGKQARELDRWRYDFGLLSFTRLFQIMLSFCLNVFGLSTSIQNNCRF